MLFNDPVFVFCPPRNNTGAFEQGVLKRRMQYLETGVHLVKDEIHRIRCLLSHLHVIRRARHVFNDLLARRKDTHQARHHRLNSVAHLRQDDLRPAFFLVAERSAAIELRRLDTGRRNVVVDETLGGSNSHADAAGEFLLAQRLGLVILRFKHVFRSVILISAFSHVFFIVVIHRGRGRHSGIVRRNRRLCR